MEFPLRGGRHIIAETNPLNSLQLMLPAKLRSNMIKPIDSPGCPSAQSPITHGDMSAAQKAKVPNYGSMENGSQPTEMVEAFGQTTTHISENKPRMPRIISANQSFC